MAEQFKTQKANGINHLSLVAQSLGRGIEWLSSSILSAKTVAESEETRRMLLNQFIGNAFGRPCPVRPRHGFVDSRPIKYEPGDYAMFMEDARNMALEVLEADPEGEIAFCNYIPADCNAILTESGVTIGPGNDGATAGRNAINIPIPSPGLPEIIAQKKDRFGVREGEAAYLEFVDADDNYLTLTQVRAGPKVEIADDYIPYSIKVGSYVTVNPEMNLLEWEAETKKYSTYRNFVVYHPGGSINSHFGVHCVINKIPYITSKEPAIGERLQKNSNVSWQQEDYDYVAKLARKYDALNHGRFFTKNSSKYASFVLGGLHAVGSLMQSRSEYSFRVVAASMVAGARLFNAVSTGEVRHAHDNTLGDSPAREFWNEANLRETALSGHHSRNAIYERALTDKNFMDSAADRVLGSYYCYSQPEWGDSYGGIPWAQCAASSFKFSKALAEFLLDPNQETITKALNEFNVLVNLAHNNGWWLNKVLNADQLQRCSNFPATSVINSTAYKIISAPALPAGRPLNEYELALARAKSNEETYRNIIEDMPNYVAGAEGSREDPFSTTHSPQPG